MVSQKTIRVVAATIEEDGRFLITQRRAEAVLPLLWEFPGGRVEEDETDQEALVRALNHRINARVEVGEELATMVHDYVGYSVTLVIFRVQLLNTDLRPARVNDFRWVPAEQFEDYEFPPADQATMDQLLSE